MFKKNYKIIIFASVFFLFMLGANSVQATVNYCLPANGGTASFDAAGQNYSTWSTASFINDDNVTTYVGLLNSNSICDYYAIYIARVDFDQPRNINQIVARTRGFSTIGFYSVWNEYERIYVYYPGTGWQEIYSTVGDDGDRTRTVNGSWNGITAVRLDFTLMTCGGYFGGSYTRYHQTYELRAFGPDPVQDIGLRVQTPGGIVSIAAEPTGTLTSQLRITKDGVVYGIALVDPGDVNDSGVRIRLASGEIKALRRL